MAVCPDCGAINPPAARFCQSCGTPVAPSGESAGASRPSEERKVVTIVFCDLTGSTALGEKMDPESLRRIITRYFGEMRRILEAHGGTVEKFIGDAVMAAFGVPAIHEDDALRAVRAAAEMQTTMALLNSDLELEWGVGLQARIGVNTGEVLAGDASSGHGFVSGDAVNVAARLEQAAQPGETLIGETTHRLVRDAVDAEAVEPLALKGKTEPMPAYRLIRYEPEAEGISRRLDSPLIGRSEELTILQDAFRSAVTERSCKLATIFGTAGAGKSRLTSEFLAALGEDVRTLVGRCVPYGEGITFLPVAQAIRGFCGISEDDPPEVARAKITDHLPADDEASLIAERIYAPMGLSDAFVETQEVFWAVRRFLEHVARSGPTIVVFDDIHWAEPTLLDLLEYMVGFSKEVPLFVLCLARRELVDTRPSWGAGSTSITLEALGAEHVAGLIQNLIGEAHLPAEAQRRIVEAAEGNPLYVEEILKMLIDDGLLERDGGHWKPTADLAGLAIPPTINALISARLDRLDEREKDVVQEASVIGKTFWWGSLVALTDARLRADLAGSLHSLVRKELIAPDQTTFAGEDAYRFSHVLIRDAAYLGLPKEHRSQLHEEFVAWLEDKAGGRAGDYEEILGYHLEQAARLRQDLGRSDDRTDELAERAAARLGAAGARALERADMPAAANLLGRATTLLPLRDAQRLELSIELSDALMEIGDYARADTTLRQIARVADEESNERIAARARVQLAQLQSFMETEGWKQAARDAVENIGPVLERTQEHAGMSRVYQLLAEVHWDDHNYSAAREALEIAHRHAVEGDRRHDEASILVFLSSCAFWGPMHVHDAIKTCEHILEEAKGNRLVTAGCLVRIGGLAAMHRQFDQARVLVSEGTSIYRELGQRVREFQQTQIGGLVELLAGDPIAAARELRLGVAAFEEMGEQAFLVTSAALLSQALFEAGEHDEAERYSRVSEEIAEDQEMLKPEWGPTRARCLVARGDFEGAESLARAAVELSVKTDDPLARGECAMALGDVLVAGKKHDEAAQSYAAARALYEAKGVLPFVDRATRSLASLPRATA